MNSDTQHPTELLPWYVNDSLSETQKQEVKSHLEGCSECQKEVKILTLIRSQVKKNASNASPGDLAKLRLMQQIRDDKRLSSSDNRSSGTRSTSQWQLWAALTAALVIVIQSTILLVKPQQSTQSDFKLLGKNAEFSVQFNNNIDIKTINEFFIQIGARIVNGPIESPDGKVFYEIDLEAVNKESSEQEIRHWTNIIKANTKVIKHITAHE